MRNIVWPIVWFAMEYYKTAGSAKGGIEKGDCKHLFGSAHISSSFFLARRFGWWKDSRERAADGSIKFQQPNFQSSIKEPIPFFLSFFLVSAFIGFLQKGLHIAAKQRRARSDEFKSVSSDQCCSSSSYIRGSKPGTFLFLQANAVTPR